MKEQVTVNFYDFLEHLLIQATIEASGEWIKDCDMSEPSEKDGHVTLWFYDSPKLEALIKIYPRELKFSCDHNLGHNEYSLAFVKKLKENSFIEVISC